MTPLIAALISVSPISQAAQPVSARGIANQNWRPLWSVEVQGHVLLSAAGKRTSKKPEWISLAELSTWSAPDAFAYHLEPSKIRLEMYSGGGSVEFNRKTGRVQVTSGRFAGLKGTALKPIRWTQSRWCLSTSREDFLINLDWARNYLGSRLRSRGAEAWSLLYAPQTADPLSTVVHDDDDELEALDFVGINFSDGALEIDVPGLTLVALDKDGEHQRSLRYSARFRNLTNRSIVVQPLLLRPLTAGVFQFDDIKGPRKENVYPLAARLDLRFLPTEPALIGQTIILPPGTCSTPFDLMVPLTGMEVFDSASEPIVMEYADGLRRYRITCARK